MAAISTRTGACTIEFDFRKNGQIERRTKTFAANEAKQAKAFYAEKLNMGKNPKVLGDGDTKPSDRKAKQSQAVAPEAPKGPNAIERHIAQSKKEPRPASLAEAFPVEPVKADAEPTMQATGDPLKITEENPVPAPAKKKRRNKKKDLEQAVMDQWKKPDTKTIVSVKFTNSVGPHDRLLIKCSDGTEETTGHMTLVHPRGHEQHHLVIRGVAFIDGMSNKHYQSIVQYMLKEAKKSQNKLTQILNNFNASKDAQKEMDKKVAAKALKPLTPEQKAVVEKIAQLANRFCGSPSMFMRSPTHLKKIGVNPQLFDLSAHGINEDEVTIDMIQHASAICRKMAPRVTIDGPQLIPQQDGTYKEPEVVKAPKAPKEEKAPKEPKQSKEKDAYGNRKGTQAADFNTLIFAQEPKFVITMDWIEKKTGIGKGRIAGHIRYLVLNGHLTKVDGGWKQAKAKASKSTAEPVVETAPVKAKAAKESKKASPKKATPKKGSTKTKASKKAKRK